LDSIEPLIRIAQISKNSRHLLREISSENEDFERLQYTPFPRLRLEKEVRCANSPDNAWVVA
jgi:hypothetical protein